jgi:N-methylhydantoinase B
VDPIDLEVIKGGLRSAQGEMEALLDRTAMSPFIREKKDYFVGIFDREGNMVLGTATPYLGDVVRPVFDHYDVADMREGDVYWYNDCYGSGGAVSHSPDQVLVTPVFVDGRLTAFAQSWAHLSDIGGMRPGSISPETTDIFQEGVIVPPVRLYRGGELNDELFRMFVRNSRYPDMVRGDMRALVAAIRLGEKRIAELARRFGSTTLERAIAALIEHTRRVARAGLVRTFPPGTYRFADKVDGDGQGGGPYTVRVELTATSDRFTFDATATDDQARGAINYLMHPSAPKMMMGMYFISGDASVLYNEGVIRALDEVKVRRGSLLQPEFPAALGQRANVVGRVMSACWGLVNVASGGGSVAASGIYVINFFRGRDPASGMPFLLSDGVGVGFGARPFADGIDAVYSVAQKNYPAEFLELNYPFRVRRYSIHCDSGGPGLYRGGCGVIREFELLADEAVFATRMEGVANPPWGVRGGQAGRPGRYVLNPGRDDERLVPALGDGHVMRRGDVISVQTGGGGGWGDPFERDPDRVLRDVRAGFVSEAAAREDYGVALARDGRAVDDAQTQALRRARRAPLGLFHRDGYFDAVQW